MNYSRSTFLFIIIIIFTASLSAYGYLLRSRNAEIPVNQVPECGTDTFTCSDGSVIGRISPACEFSTCPSVLPVTNPATSTQNRATGTLYGKVTLSPVCPVERNPPDPQCAPKPYVTDIRIYTIGGKDTGVTTRTAADGTFEVKIIPGTYIVRATNGAVYPRCEEKQVSVIGNKSTTITLSCDTGIR